MKTFFYFLVVVAFTFYGCAKRISDDTLIIEPPLYPSCVKDIIDSSLSKPKGSIALEMYKGIYKNTLIFYIISGCCDRYNPVYDANCNYLFSPSGGISGAGDFTHPNFFKEAKIDSVPIWKDPR